MKKISQMVRFVMWNYSESCQPGPQMQQGSNHSGYDGYNGFPTSSNTFGSSIPLYRYPNIATRGGGERSKIKGLYNTIKGHETVNVVYVHYIQWYQQRAQFV